MRRNLHPQTKHGVLLLDEPWSVLAGRLEEIILEKRKR
jgi:hypothetical protein